MERTLILIKPDGVQRGLIGEVIGRFERRGLRLVGMKFMQMSRELAMRHYAAHEGKPFFPGLIDYITSGPIVAMVWEGKQAIAVARKTMGITRPAEAEPGTIRGDFALEVGRNIVHGSDGPESAAGEVALYFSPEELVDWARETDRWIFE
ncbi:MAG: nucleoside-diphosphate kinase [Anaerolineae bacterium]|nr:nucleoside-diphosphate kinase [Anaerolineae bacterium]